VEHPFTRDKVEEKFLALAVPVYGEEKAAKIVQAVDGFEEISLPDLLQLLR